MKREVFNESQWIRLVKQTRAHGSCYVPVDSRDGMEIGGRVYGWKYYGRSGIGGGHKHKAYCHDSEGRPVPTKGLKPANTESGEQ